MPPAYRFTTGSVSHKCRTSRVDTPVLYDVGTRIWPRIDDPAFGVGAAADGHPGLLSIVLYLAAIRLIL